jgi:hypothetical protein
VLFFHLKERFVDDVSYVSKFITLRELAEGTNDEILMALNGTDSLEDVDEL